MNATERARPALFPFITLRHERFGALLFNPYFAREEELDPVEAAVASLCDGTRTRKCIEAQTAVALDLPAEESARRVAAVLQRLNRAGALTMGAAPRGRSAPAPAASGFPADGPYLSAPKSVIWDVTYACNLHCQHCLTSSGMAHPEELTTEEGMALVAQLAEMQALYLSLSGGEPFLRPDIVPLLERIADTGMRVDIATNGLYLPPTVLRVLDALPLFQVQVSIDGIGERHDAFRGRQGAFAAACRTVQRLRDRGMAVALSTTVTRGSLDQLDAIIDLALTLDCSGFKAIPFLPAGRGAEHAAQLQLDLEGCLRFARTIAARSRELSGRLAIATETTFAFLLQAVPMQSGARGPMGCSAGYDTMSIGADGRVYPCPFLRHLPLGNVRRGSLRQLWTGAPDLVSLRTLQKRDMDEPCRSCDYAPLACRGGCRAAAYLASGSIRAVDPSCFASLPSSPIMPDGRSASSG